MATTSKRNPAVSSFMFRKSEFSAHGSIMANSDMLGITDTRTGKSYSIPIRNNAVNAVDFAAISASGVENGAGLKVFDPGYHNTAVKESSITYVYVPHYLLKPQIGVQVLTNTVEMETKASSSSGDTLSTCSMRKTTLKMSHFFLYGATFRLRMRKKTSRET